MSHELDDRPSWARRIREEREARGWSQSKLVAALRTHSEKELPSDSSMLRRLKSWEAGENQPDAVYKALLAKTFGTVTAAIWVETGRRNADADLIAGAGMDTLEIIARLRASSIDQATIDALRITVDRLCSEYPYLPSEQLLIEGRQWLRRITNMLDRRMTLAQHKEILGLAGILAALVGCVEYDRADPRRAESTRRAALSLGEESVDVEVIGWAYEMRAWFALTQGDYYGVIRAAEEGEERATNTRAAVQLSAQRAKAWARVGDRRQVEVALDKGRTLLERQSYPDNLDHHFVVDPLKWDFYAMDCYRHLGVCRDVGETESRLAENYACDVIRRGADFDGTERSPMRIAEARITLGVVAARQGDLEGAVTYGKRALADGRQSLPSLLMVSNDLATILRTEYGHEAQAVDYLEQLDQIRTSHNI